MSKSLLIKVRAYQYENMHVGEKKKITLIPNLQPTCTNLTSSSVTIKLIGIRLLYRIINVRNVRKKFCGAESAENLQRQS